MQVIYSFTKYWCLSKKGKEIPTEIVYSRDQIKLNYCNHSILTIIWNYKFYPEFLQQENCSNTTCKITFLSSDFLENEMSSASLSTGLTN